MARISIDLKKGSVREEKELVAGIDLGTTNSLIAFVKDGQPYCLTIENETTLVPSVIHFNSNGEASVGNTAKSYLIDDPANSIYSVKRLIGRSYNEIKENKSLFNYHIHEFSEEGLAKVQIANRFYTPVELSSLILAKLKNSAESALKTQIHKVVITVPAYFNDIQRQATRDAGKLAGLEVLRIINEPTAASLAFGINETGEDQNIVVYDFGGGTFDVSVLRLEGGVFEVLATSGDTFLGGDDIDQAIINFWMSKSSFENKSNQKSFYQELRLKAEEAKKELSEKLDFTTNIGESSFALSRAELNQIALPFLQRTIDCCKQVMTDSKLSNTDISKVLMVGGSTRMPFVKDFVGNFFNTIVDDRLNPDEVVALGAAIQAEVLTGGQKNILLLDVTPLSLGIETIGGLMDVILPRNSKIPSRVARNYTTSIDGQTNLKVAIYQGERDMVHNNRKLGEFILKGIPPMPAGLPKIEVRFMLDANGLLTVGAKELRSGVDQSIDINSAYSIAEEEMGRMLMDSTINAKEDIKQKAIVEASVEAKMVIQSTKKFIGQNASWLNEENKNEFNRFIDNVQNKIESNSKDEIYKSLIELNKYAEPFAHEALDRSVLAALSGTKIPPKS